MDLNPHQGDSNPKEIRIPSEDEVKLKSMDLNPRKMDSNPYEEQVKRVKSYLNTVYNDSNP